MAFLPEGGIVSTNNSTTSTLGAGASFTGTAEDITNYGVVVVTVYSDVASATDGLEIEWSTDGTNWDGKDMFTIPASTQKTFSFPAATKYYRISYTNGGDAQSTFRLQTSLKQIYTKSSSHRIQDSILDEDDAELVKAVITGEVDGDGFVNFKGTKQGNFRVAVEEFGDTPSIDPFGRLRVSSPYTIFDSKQLHDKQPLFWDEATGGSATSNHSPTDANTAMTVTANAADYVIRQTKQRFNYQPGKGMLIFLTFHSPQTTGTTKRIGYFDGTGVNSLTPNNGIFFESDGDISWNIAKNGTITQNITQDNWNIDKLDGTGISGKTLDTDAPQILIIDFEWLGVGRVRVGFVIDGLIYYCHYFNHANNSTFDSVYMSTPNLPLRYSIESDGTGTDTLDHICSTVMSEGGIEETGVLRSVNTGTTHLDAATADTSYALIGIRLKTNYLDISVIPEYANILSETTTDLKWELQLNPTVNGTFTYGSLANSAIEYALGATANDITTPGEIIDSGFISSTDKSSGSSDRKFVTSLRIGSQIDGTRDTLVLCVTPFSADADIHGSLTFR